VNNVEAGGHIVRRDASPDDGPKEACGVFAVYAPDSPVAHLTYAGLYALQHRGQEAAGMAVSDGEHLFVVKDTGLVTHAFDERRLGGLSGHLAIGHVRYSTTGSSVWSNAQPVFREANGVEFALGHNGNLVNTAELAADVGMLESTWGTDSDVMAEHLRRELDGHGTSPSLERALRVVLQRARGAFSLVLLDQRAVYGVRDPHGFRPLCLGRLDSGWVMASETAALDIVGATFIREVEPGEMVVIDEQGCRSVRLFPVDEAEPKLCLFEFVYFARPDSQLYGRNVHAARRRMGELLAAQAPLSSDPAGRDAMVMPVPESGIPAAQGFARASGIPYGDGLTKNRYIGRTFIAPSQAMRQLGVRMKLNPLRENIAGKRLVVVDDSIVRGTTTRQIVAMLRAAGAAEVHLRVSSPPYKWPCFYGMDTNSPSELLAANLSFAEIVQYLGCDSLAYLELDRLVEATGAKNAGFCTACLSGEYPVAPPRRVGVAKSALEIAAEVNVDDLQQLSWS
jgi:amidophosphoribosyltransferase